MIVDFAILLASALQYTHVLLCHGSYVNFFRHGSYGFDARLNAIANRNYDGNGREEQQVNEPQMVRDDQGILAQRFFLQYFLNN